MAKITDFRELKRRQARKRGMKLLALIALVLVGTYLLSSIVNTPNFAGLSSVVDMIKGGPGYPIDAPGGKAKGMYQNESSLVMLNETTIYFYNTSGSEVYSAQHRMGNPQVETSGTMLLNYDRGSKTYAAYSRTTCFTAERPTAQFAAAIFRKMAALRLRPRPKTHRHRFWLWTPSSVNCTPGKRTMP